MAMDTGDPMKSGQTEGAVTIFRDLPYGCSPYGLTLYQGLYRFGHDNKHCLAHLLGQTMKDLTINNLHDAITALELARHIFKTNVWWRGQADATWRLVPAVHRQDRGNRYENYIARLFQLRAPARYANCPKDDDLPGWLFLMQHYRLPTRLLDWTESVLIALLFAVREFPSRPAALWALCPFKLNQCQTGRAVIWNPRCAPVAPLFIEAFSTPPETRPNGPVAAVYPSEVDVRMMLQLSTFTVHATARPLEETPDNKNFLMRFDVPPDAKAFLKPWLRRLGIRESNLFPDLEHLASDLASLQVKPQEPDTSEPEE